jgi:2-polyprenyl-6-methoxyphenol hydroxylase-like FAD-dependent oxidoreductase
VTVETVTVLGGGMAGLSAALLLARQGQPVRLIERDRLDVGGPLDAPGWERRGLPQFLQPHAFIPRGRKELRTRLPDVYEALLAAGARDVDARTKMPGAPVAEEAGDEDLQFLAVRRPLIEWALRRAVEHEPGIEVRDGVRVDGLVVEGGRVTGVRVEGATVDAAAVVDALGRRTPTGGWLADAGVGSAPTETSDCGVVYYSRYYRQRPGFELPDGPWVLGPRGDLGYAGFATFPGDNGTFAALLSVPSGVPEWRVLSDAGAFEACVGQIPPLRQWVDPAGVEPLTDVLPMAGLRNSFRHYDPAAGLVPIGDAASHTDPVVAYGLSFALIHAAALASALEAHPDRVDAFEAYAAAARPWLRERYELATALDEQRHRLWLGEPVDFTRHDGDYALFSLVAGGVASMMDVEIFRMFSRRTGLLDSTAVLDDDLAMQRRIEDLFARATSTPRPPSGPPRDEMLAIATAASGRRRGDQAPGAR